MSGFDDYLAAPIQQQGPSFDAYLGAAAAPAPSQTPAPQASQPGMLASPTAQDFAMGGASPDTLTQLGQIASAGAHGIGSMVNNMANFAERHLPFFPADIAARDTAAQAQSDAQWQANASPGEKASAIVGPLLLPMSGAMAPGNAIRAGVAALPRLANVGGMAVPAAHIAGSLAGNATNGAILATGAPITPNQPVGPQDASHLEWGAGLGAGLPALWGIGRAGATSLYNAVRPILNPRAYVGQQYSSMFDNPAQAAASIRGAPQFVQDSMPTTAQAIQTPLAVATEKAQANSNPAFKIALADRNADQNAARWRQLMGVAQDQPALDAATAARDAAATPLYQQAHQATANVGPAFMRYAQIPEMQEAMARANATASLDAAVGRGIPPVWPQQGGSQSINGAALDYTSRALDDMINEATRAGNNNRAASLRALQSNVDGWTQRYIPGVRQASDTYAQMSVPINTMQVGQGIANSLGTRSMVPGAMGGLPQLTLDGYRTALTREMNNAPYGIEAGAHGNLQGIGQDLQRASISNGLKSPGSDTAYNIAANGWLARQLYGQNFGGASGIGRGLGALGATLTGHPWIGAGILTGGRRLGQMVSAPLNTELNDLLLNPNGLLPYLDARAAAPINATQQALGGLLQRQVLPAALGGLLRSGLVQSP